ncbi:hypothetical protein AX774_g5922 [Zancudomyces culisetae]|uniref:Uncharacterized protein n=1 Tax=Zancudomyces culisetae TaxID=1213189 RepID=A0A1R1PI36_ZANCU|nr:hypothetical protein AX774_g5922 [Zancudomyces culisetae]|eukprot:OMH80640.1 hypothetical protein AX774_g5922 [Zancudomyces culisetae]
MVLWSHLILTSNIVASLALDLVCEVIDRIKIFFQLSGSVVIRLLGEGHEAINDILKSANEVLNSATERLGDGIFFFSQYGANFSDNTADDGSKAYKAGIVETDDKYESYGGSTRQRKSRRAKVD